MAKKKSLFQEFTKGILVENPVLRLVLGTCPTLAVSTSVESALGMGVAASIVLVCSNIAIAALKKVIPQKVRIPAYIVIIASFVTIVQMLVKAFVPQIDAQLGVYLPLIVVNCIILGRAEAFACKNSVAASAVDGLGMGVGFTAALLLMGAVRELLGTGAIAGLQIIPASVSPMLIFILPPGGFFVFGLLILLCLHQLVSDILQLSLLLRDLIRKDLDIDKILPLVKTRIEVLPEVKDHIDFFEALPDYDVNIYVHKKMKTNLENALEILKEEYEVLKVHDDWSLDSLHDLLMQYIADKGIKNGTGLWPVRIAVSGRQMTPGGAFEILEILGKEESLKRIETGIEMLTAANA